MGDSNVDAVAIYHAHDDERITPIVASITTSNQRCATRCCGPSKGADVLFEGVVVPPDGWIEQVRALGPVGVIAGAGITSAPGWERQLPRLARESELLGSVATVTRASAFGRRNFTAFAYEVISALRPSSPAETLHSVSFALEDDRPHRAVIEAVGSAARHQIVIPARIFDMVHRRATDRTSFGWRDARALKRLLRKVRTDAGTSR